MGKANAKFTVIVPTRERSDTLVHCLRTLLAQDYENLTILVSDNFSQDKTRDVVASCDDERLCYVNTGKRVGMSRNWEFALSHVDSGWVTFLGDDDGMLPGAIARLDEMVAEYPCEAINSSFCNYLWPKRDGSNSARLSVPTTRGIKYLYSRVELEAVMAGTKPYNQLPWLYHGGFATVDVINRGRDSTGSFFKSRIPDIYSSIAISSVTETFLRIETPLVVAGSSIHSTGISAANMNQSDSFNTFLSEENTSFHPSLVFGKSVRLVMYECYLQSCFLHHDFQKLDLKNQLGFALAEASRKLGKEIIEQCQAIAVLNGITLSRYSMARIGYEINIGAIRFLQRLLNVHQRAIFVGEDAAGSNVFEASRRAEQIVSRANMQRPQLIAIENITHELRRRVLGAH